MKIFIIGYMASGKTTFGKALASKLKTRFIDLDDYIEKKAGKSISEIFTESGEEGFRKLESELMREVADMSENLVIACGGGTPCHGDNIKILNEKGVTVFLETSTPVLISRLIAENDKRPLMAGKSEEEIEEKVLTQLCHRLPYYMESKLKWHGDDLETEEEIKENVENFISSYPSVFR